MCVTPQGIQCQGGFLIVFDSWLLHANWAGSNCLKADTISRITYPSGKYVNYLSTGFPVFKLASVCLEGCVWSLSSCVCLVDFQLADSTQLGAPSEQNVKIDFKTWQVVLNTTRDQRLTEASLSPGNTVQRWFSYQVFFSYQATQAWVS